MKKGVYVKETDITVKENKEPCRNVELRVRLDNNDIFERVVSVTAEIFDAQKRCIIDVFGYCFESFFAAHSSYV